MRIWLTCFGMLFAIAELYQWAKDLSLPLPIYILGGAFLAIASNYNKRSGLFQASPEPPSAINSANSTSWDNLSPSQQPSKPVSFTIKRSSEQNHLDETKLS